MTVSVWRAAGAEALGTAALLSIVVGSGIMGASLSAGNDGQALLLNALCTGAGLWVLITTLAPVSGAHLNPVVSAVAVLTGSLGRARLIPYVFAQVGGALVGVAVAHAMFGLPLAQTSTHARGGANLALSEVVATFGLVFVVLAGGRVAPSRTPLLVASYVVSAYGFTASTAFANPAVTLARAFTDTFAGIQGADVPLFIAAQGLGATLATFAAAWLYRGVDVGSTGSDADAPTR